MASRVAKCSESRPSDADDSKRKVELHEVAIGIMIGIVLNVAAYYSGY